MNPPAKLSDLMMALEMPSEEMSVRFDRQTGKMVWVEDYILRAIEEEERLTNVPDWQKEEVALARAIVNDDGSRFIAAPDKFDFHEYRHMERFIGTVPDQPAADELWRAIKGRGAFRHFKDTAHRLGLLDNWYRHRDTAMKEFVIEWAQANQVPYVDDSPKPQA
jgi:hypothetical protein